MADSEREKRDAGEWYCCLDAELEDIRCRVRRAVHLHNILAPDERGNIAPALRDVMGHAPADAIIEAPFHCIYGANIFLGKEVFINAGCSFLDTAPLRIGDFTMIGPMVQIYCAEHHRDPVKRRARLEIARPVTIGDNVWIGGAAIILAGVSIGDDAIIGAGAVVTRDVAGGTTVVGNPARVMS